MFGANRIWSSFEEYYMQIECSVEVENVCFKILQSIGTFSKGMISNNVCLYRWVRRTHSSGQGHWKSVRVGSRPQNRWPRAQNLTLSCESAARGARKEAVQVQEPPHLQRSVLLVALPRGSCSLSRHTDENECSSPVQSSLEKG